MRMHSDRLPEESKRALRTVLEGLRRLAKSESAEEQDDIPQQDPPYVLFQKLLAAAKAPREGDNIDDIRECFNKKGLEPVLPLRPPPRVSKFDQYTSAVRRLLSEENITFLRRDPTINVRKFRRDIHGVYKLYLKSIEEHVREKRSIVIQGCDAKKEWDFSKLAERDRQLKLTMRRLRIAGYMYVWNIGNPQAFALPAIERLRDLLPPVIDAQPAPASA